MHTITVIMFLMHRELATTISMPCSDLCRRASWLATYLSWSQLCLSCTDCFSHHTEPSLSSFQRFPIREEGSMGVQTDNGIQDGEVSDEEGDEYDEGYQSISEREDEYDGGGNQYDFEYEDESDDEQGEEDMSEV